MNTCTRDGPDCDVCKIDMKWDGSNWYCPKCKKLFNIYYGESVVKTVVSDVDKYNYIDKIRLNIGSWCPLCEKRWFIDKNKKITYPLNIGYYYKRICPECFKDYIIQLNIGEL